MTALWQYSRGSMVHQGGARVALVVYWSVMAAGTAPWWGGAHGVAAIKGVLLLVYDGGSVLVSLGCMGKHSKAMEGPYRY